MQTLCIGAIARVVNSLLCFLSPSGNADLAASLIPAAPDEYLLRAHSLPLCRIRVDMAESGIIGTGGALLGSAELTAWLPPRRRPKDQPGLRYPAVAPVLALACPGLPAPALRAATAALVSSALGLLGTPMLYELASALPEILSSASAAREEKPVDAVKSPDARGDAEVRLEQQRAGVSSTSSGRNTTVRCGKGGLGPAVCVEEESARLLREWEAWKVGSAGAWGNVFRRRCLCIRLSA